MTFLQSIACALFLSVATGQTPPVLTVQGIGGRSVTLASADLLKLPQQKFTVADHGSPATFEGVLLRDVLATVDTPSGEKFHHTAASYYLLVRASDGYRAVFAWAELDPTFTDKVVYLATGRDGKPLAPKEGPFMLVAPGEKRGARSVRGVTALVIQQAGIGL